MATLDYKRKSMSIYRMSDVQPDLNQTDTSQPDYVKGKDSLQEVRVIQVNGEEFLDANSVNVPLNLQYGKGIKLSTDGSNTIIISATGSGGTGGSGDEVIEGEGIDIEPNDLGQKVISLKSGAITDKYVSSISISKIDSDGQTIILHGGNANDETN